MDTQLFGLYSVFVVLVFACGAYCILRTANLVRAVIGVEIMIKAATLLIILAGRLSGNSGLAQSIVITLIVIEVVFMVVAGGLILAIFRTHGSIDTHNLRKLKG